MRVFTNDEAALNTLADTDLQIDLWTWRDGLHLGPVSLEWDLDRFSEERAFFLSALGWDAEGTLDADFKLRNEALLDTVSKHESLALIFSDSPRDQLQLTQIISWMQLRSPSSLDRAAIFESAAEFLEAMPTEGDFESKGVSLEESEARTLAWLAFVSPDPRLMERQATTSASEPVRELLSRLLLEFPSVENGLSLTECQILDAVASGVKQPREVFAAMSEAEGRRFYNDWEFWVILERLILGATPLLEIVNSKLFLRPPVALAWTEFEDQHLRLTEEGEKVMTRGSGEFAILGERWIGGTKIGSEGSWQWDYANGCLQAAG